MKLALSIALIVTSVLMILLVLLHKGKGSGLSDLFGGGISSHYGGSVKSSNVVEIMKQVDVDGALIGGASLDPEELAKIAKFYAVPDA